METALLVGGILLVSMASLKVLGQGIGWGDNGETGQATEALQRDAIDNTTSEEEPVEAARNVDGGRSSGGIGYSAATLSGNPQFGGDFEDGLDTSWTYYHEGATIHTAGASVGNWKVVDGSIETHEVDRHLVGEGGRSIDLNGNQPGAMQQTVPVVPGVSYTISMTVGENTMCGPSTKSMAVEWAGERVAELDVNLPRGESRTYEVQLPAVTTDSAALTLRGLSSTACGVVIDDASITLDPV